MKDDLSRDLKLDDARVGLRKKAESVFRRKPAPDILLHERDEGWIDVPAIERVAIYPKRPNKRKKKGWQITIRGNLREVLRDTPGKGFLLFLRGKGYLIPLTEIYNFVISSDNGAFIKDTIGIYVDVGDSGAVIRYHGNALDISKHALPR